jgi:hypothetical protein
MESILAPPALGAYLLRCDVQQQVYCPPGSSTPLIAQAGEYTIGPSNSTMEDVLPCPSGFFCVHGSAVACPAGRFGCANRLSDATCNGPCTAGFYCPVGSSSSQAYVLLHCLLLLGEGVEWMDGWGGGGSPYSCTRPGCWKDLLAAKRGLMYHALPTLVLGVRCTVSLAVATRPTRWPPRFSALRDPRPPCPWVSEITRPGALWTLPIDGRARVCALQGSFALLGWRYVPLDSCPPCHRPSISSPLPPPSLTHHPHTHCSAHSSVGFPIFPSFGQPSHLLCPDTHACFSCVPPPPGPMPLWKVWCLLWTYHPFL